MLWEVTCGYWAVIMPEPAQGLQEPQPSGARLENANGFGDMRGEEMSWSREGTFS